MIVDHITELIKRKHPRLKSNAHLLLFLKERLKLLGFELDHGQPIDLDLVVHGFHCGIFKALYLSLLLGIYVSDLSENLLDVALRLFYLS